MEKQQQPKEVSEFTVMGRIERELTKLKDDHQRRRVVNWVLQKLGDDDPVFAQQVMRPVNGVDHQISS